MNKIYTHYCVDSGHGFDDIRRTALFDKMLTSVSELKLFVRFEQLFRSDGFVFLRPNRYNLCII